VRWVQRYAPEFEKRWRPVCPGGRPVTWRAAYLKIRGKWRYLYRAADLALLAHQDARR
jgi:transposase-like protein